MTMGVYQMRRYASALVCLALLVTAMPPASSDIAPADRRSDYAFMSRDTQTMQDDDSANPAMLWVNDGQALWARKEGSAQRSCMDCHGDAGTRMKGVAARYPVFDATRNRPMDLEERIMRCRIDQQKATPFAYESKELLALTAYIARQSHGLPITAGDDARLKPFIAAGREIFERRQGQLNISPGMAGSRLIAAAAARMHVRDSRRPLPVRCPGECRARTLSDVARTRHANGYAGGAAVKKRNNRWVRLTVRCRKMKEAASLVRSLSRPLRGEGWGEGLFANERVESPPHPDR